MDDRLLLTLLDQRIERARDTGLTEQQARLAINYYLNRPRGDETEGRSQIQSADVADMVHAVLAQLQPAFSGDSLCEFEPQGPGDETQASLESRAVNQVLMESNRGYVAIQQALHNALLLGTGVLKVYAEDRDGRRRLVLAAVDPLNFWVDDSQQSPILDEARGTFERKCLTRGELVAMGIDREKVEQLPIFATDYDSDIRQPGAVRQARDTQSGWANEEVEVFECYVKMPEDQDSSETHLQRILKGEGQILLREDAQYICYAVGSPILLPGVVRGLGLYDREKSVQDQKTAVLRQLIDSFGASNLSRLAVNGEMVNMDDLLSGRVNGVVRVRGMPGEAILPIPNQDIGAQAIATLQYLDQVRSDRGGAALAMQSADSQIIGSQIGAAASLQVLSVQEQVSAWYAQNLAQTMIRSVFLHAHRLLRTEIREPMAMQVAGQWVQVNPADWQPRDRINISAGLSPGERVRKAGQLQSLVTYQTQLLTAGFDGILITPENLYSSLMAWGRASGIDGIERMFQDPSSPQSRQALQGKAQQGQQQQQLGVQLEQAKLAVEQSRLQLESQKLELEKYKHDTELKWKYYDTDKDNEAREAELVGRAATDIQLATLRAQADSGIGSDTGRSN